MKNTSTEFNTIAENPFGAKYIHKIIDLTNNTEIKDDIDDFLYSAMINDDDVFTIGNTCSATISFSITNPTINLNNKEIEVYQGLDINGTVEYIKLGVFKVLKPKKDRSITKYQCVDRMTYLMNMPYSSNLTFPTTDVKILQEICSQVEISLVQNGLISHSISKKPSGYTKREIIAYMSQLQGKNATINSDGNLELIWYTDTDYVVDDNKIYYDGTSDVNSEIDYKVEYLECTVRSLDGTDETVIKAGAGTNGIKIENPFMTQTILYELANKLVGFTFRGAEFEFLGDFRLEVGDVVSVETNGEVYRVPIMQIEHRSDGGVVTTITSIGETDTENEIDLSSPNVNAMDRYYADLVLINKAMINKLSVDEADIKYLKVTQLEGIEANIENAVIENLEGEFITVEEFDAEKARITVLEANSLTSDSAIIKDLQAGVTKTNTLIFGSASGGSIQTSFSNSVIAQLGDAQIKSAMIAEVDAGKITSGSIYTNKVNIFGDESGKLSIVDNTIAISDGTRTRVQIGKDASSDYNMYVWDKSGNLMFDALGLTEDGVTRKIIRDDIVKDDANISAEKLNIESLFNVINKDGSHTLKSSKIYVDADNQTLDVSFKNMTTNIATVTTSVDNANNVANSALQSATVASDKIDNLSIGGTQIIRGTNTSTKLVSLGNSTWSNGSWRRASGGSAIITSINISNSPNANIKKGWRIESTSQSDTTDLAQDEVPVSYGKIYTMSCYARVISGNPILNFQVWKDSNNHTETTIQLSSSDTAWKQYSFTFTHSFKDYPNELNIYFGNRRAVGVFEICGMKLEEGNRPTAWSPAPEDVDSSISAVNDKVTTVTETVTTQGTQISMIQGQILSKIWQQDITTAVDNIEVGGRNLLLSTSQLNKWILETAVTVTEQDDGSFLIDDTQNRNGRWGINQPRTLELGETYTCSCDIKGQAKIELSNGNGFTSECVLAVLIDNNSEDFVHYERTFTVTSSNVRSFYINTTDYCYIKNLKLEKGNKATDWTPAPEDTEANITALNTQYSSISQSVNSISGTVASHATQIQEKADAKTVTKISDNLTLMQADLDGFKTTVSSTYTTKTDFNNLEIGGRNLVINSSKYRKDSPYTRTSSAKDGVSVTDMYMPCKNGETYTFQCCTDGIWGKHITNGTAKGWTDIVLLLQTEGQTGDQYARAQILIKAPELGLTGKQTWTYTVPDNDAKEYTQITFRFDIHSDGVTEHTVNWWDLKAERGTKATDWTPAPEDIDTELESTKSIATQTSEMMDWLVESGTSATNFTLTDRMAELTAQIINLNGNVKVSGDMLVDGAVTADKLSTDSIKSRNFAIDATTGYITQGMYINLQDGTLNSRYVSWDNKGKLKATSVDLSGNINATTGAIGNWVLDDDGYLYAKTLVGTTTAGTLYKTYLKASSGSYDSVVVGSSIASASSEDLEEWMFRINADGTIITKGQLSVYSTDGITTTGPITTTKKMSCNDGCYINGKTELHGNGLELYYTTPYIDFHYNNDTTDHTARIAENSKGALTVYNSISNASDRRLKQDISDLDKKYLNALNLFNPVSYRFIKGSDNLYLGFIAQDIEKALIDSGITDLPLISKDDNGIYSLDYSQITALNTLGHLDHEERIQQLENNLAVANALIQSLLIQQSTV